jgi:hypothetical protein
MTIDRANLTENQLRGIITFFKMPYNRRHAIVEITNTRIENSWEIFEKNKKGMAMNFPLTGNSKKCFLSVK